MSDEKPVDKAHESAEVELVNSFARAASRGPGLLVVAVLTLLMGTGVGVRGWNASSESKEQFESLTKKVDKIAADLDDTRKAVDRASNRGEDQRHEARIQSLEAIVQERGLILARYGLEIEALKKGK